MLHKAFIKLNAEDCCVIFALTENLGSVLPSPLPASINAPQYSLTDLKVYLSADNGSNFTQGTLTALPSYDSSGTKMAKVNDVSVTAGTQLKYKIEFGNQADFSKEVRITGVSVQY